MRTRKYHTIIDETEHLLKMMRENFSKNIQEVGGVEPIFTSIQAKLKNIYLRPNNIIDAGRYSQAKIDGSLFELGYEFRKEIEGKLHYFNKTTSVSLYLNPKNRKITLTP